MQSTSNEPEPGDWNQISPLLDEALNSLDEKEHDAVVLRFFDGKQLKQVGAAMGITEDTARMRVNRGLEKLRKFFTNKGVALSTTAIAGAVAANSVQAAPVALAATITAAALSGTTITTAAVIAATKGIAMTTLQKTVITAALVVAASAGIYEARQAADARAKVQTLQQQQAPLTEQIQLLTQERGDLTSKLAALLESNKRQNTNLDELLRLRGQVGTLRQQLAGGDNAKVQTEQTPLSSAQQYFERARKNSIDHNYKGALDDLNKAIEMDPGLADAYFERGNLYAMNLPKADGGHEKAVADLSRFLELKPNDCSGRHNRAGSYQQLGQYDNAIADFTTLIEGETDFSRVLSKEKQLALEYHYRGRVYQWHKKDYAQALADYNQALRLDPNIEGVHRLRGQCYEALGQPEKAQEDFSIEKPN